MAANEAHFCDCCHCMGHFLCGVERVKCFVNIHLHCIYSNLKRVRKRLTMSSWKKLFRRPFYSLIYAQIIGNE